MQVVEPARGWRFPDLREAWAHRDLLYLFVRRDVAVRYRQTTIGAAWAILQPLLLAVVFSLFFGHYARVPSAPGIPYPVFVVAGMVMWLFFASSMSSASQSTVGSADLISRVYFPRIIIPLAAVIPPLLDFMVAFIVVLVTMLVYGVDPSVRVVLIPGITLLAMMTALGMGLWLSAMHVRYRDVQHVVPFIVLVGMFTTPIVYPFDIIPSSVQPIFALNPMVGVLEGYRWALFPSFSFPGAILLIPVIVSVVLVVTGALFFERMENTFADVI